MYTRYWPVIGFRALSVLAVLPYAMIVQTVRSNRAAHFLVGDRPMHRHIVFVPLLFVLAAAIVKGGPKADDAVHDEIAAAVNALSDAFNRGDVRSLAHAGSPTARLPGLTGSELPDAKK